MFAAWSQGCLFVAFGHTWAALGPQNGVCARRTCGDLLTWVYGMGGQDSEEVFVELDIATSKRIGGTLAVAFNKKATAFYAGIIPWQALNLSVILLRSASTMQKGPPLVQQRLSGLETGVCTRRA